MVLSPLNPALGGFAAGSVARTLQDGGVALEQHARVLIAGGGIIGSSIAAALVERGVSDVYVVDLDLHRCFVEDPSRRVTEDLHS